MSIGRRTELRAAPAKYLCISEQLGVNLEANNRFEVHGPEITAPTRTSWGWTGSLNVLASLIFKLFKILDEHLCQPTGPSIIIRNVLPC